jgi:hypothetical protein
MTRRKTSQNIEISGGNIQPGDQVITAEQAAAGRTATPRLRF